MRSVILCTQMILCALMMLSCGSTLDLPSDTRGGCGGGPPVDVAGTYSAEVEGVHRDLITGEVAHLQRQSLELVVSQSGAAVSYTGILGVAGADGVAIDDRYRSQQGGYPYTVQWSGTIQPDASTEDLVVRVLMWHPEAGGDTVLQDYEVTWSVSEVVRLW